MPRPRPGTGVSSQAPAATARSRPTKIVDPPEQFTQGTVFGVPVNTTSAGVARREGRSGGANGHHSGDSGHHGDTYNHNTYNHSTYNTYIDGVSRCNGWGWHPRWSSCGPCHSWQRYDCDSGFSFTVGFGFGFSFGAFYGTSCAPLCSNWCNPWWDGYAVAWNCAPTYTFSYSHCSPYGGWWNPCYSWRDRARWWCGPCPLPGWAPCYRYPTVYSAGYSTITTYEVVQVAAAPTPAYSIPTPDALWTLLADGYDRDAENGFVLLEAVYPNDQRWVAGQAIARAFRGDTVRAASLFRQAFAIDASVIERLSHDPRFSARLEALERSLGPAAAAHQPSIDALLVLAAAQAARGDLAGAYLNATTAEDEGDGSVGTQELVAWLRGELRRRP